MLLRLLATMSSVDADWVRFIISLALARLKHGNQLTASMKHYHPCHTDPQSPIDLPGLTFLPKKGATSGKPVGKTKQGADHYGNNRPSFTLTLLKCKLYRHKYSGYTYMCMISPVSP